MNQVSAKHAELFFKKVEITPKCWEWLGNKHYTGYGRIMIDGHEWRAHRLSYLLHVGEIPPGFYVDHKCWNRACVNPNHLRAVTHKQNMENQAGPHKGSSSGVRGVCWDKVAKKWRAQITHERKVYFLGRYDDLAEAERVVRQKRLDLFTHNDIDRIDGFTSSNQHQAA